MQNYHKQNSNKRPMGFAGLASMVSDVDDIVAQEICNAEKISKPQAAVATSAVTPSPASASTSSPQPQHRNSSESEKPNNKGRNWIIGLAVIAGVYWFANRPDDSAPSSTSDISSSTYSATTDTSSTINSSSASESETSPVEQTPPIGTNLVLSRAQIKYCLAESIRLEAARGVLNSQNNSDTKLFNKYVDDYNRRCSSYRYRQNDYDIANRDVQQRQYEYQNEGRARF
ncbi:hypothetical protein [Citrobacter sedlakii]|uniref:hypothetical protein n=1 Tax=Citrobacter sedlakii TaxID=67826 RepID=UPI0020C08D50|nr:hypothetical protein [Citrobacter sedlakii]MCK8146685.1 hypothetical protein [Citrobacter sedlakii]HBP8780028.1 hypothetical protein [Escherichia coli]